MKNQEYSTKPVSFQLTDVINARIANLAKRKAERGELGFYGKSQIARTALHIGLTEMEKQETSHEENK